MRNYWWLLWARACLERSHAHRRSAWWWDCLGWPAMAQYHTRESNRWWVRHRAAALRFPRPETAHA